MKTKIIIYTFNKSSRLQYETNLHVNKMQPSHTCTYYVTRKHTIMTSSVIADYSDPFPQNYRW